jgi:hypothetical protein
MEGGTFETRGKPTLGRALVTTGLLVTVLLVGCDRSDECPAHGTAFAPQHVDAPLRGGRGGHGGHGHGDGSGGQARRPVYYPGGSYRSSHDSNRLCPDAATP